MKMSNFHASIRDIFEDVHRFLSCSLQNEVLSSSSLTHKEKLLSRLKFLQNDYPELQLQFCETDGIKSDSTRCSPTSPLPYVDMNGAGNPYKIPFFSSIEGRESYDVIVPKEKCDSLENQSITESEGYASDDAKFLPEIAASDLYSCDKAGYLDKKKRDSIKGWLNPFQKRWCAIKNGVLYYYEKTTDRKQKGSIMLAGYEARILLDDSKDGKKYTHCFELVCPGKRTYQFSAASDKDLQQWISAVERNSKILSLGRSSNRESQLLSSGRSSKSMDHDKSHDDTEGIYETVEDENPVKEDKDTFSLHNAPLKSEINESPVLEDENNQDEIFNYSEWYVGLWDCLGSDDSELSFYRGDLIHVISKEYDNFAWWIGELQGKIGFVPKTYLMEAYESY